MILQKSSLFLVFVFGILTPKAYGTFISVHGKVTCCEKPATACGHPEELTVTLNEWPRKTLMKSEFSMDGSYQISVNHAEAFLVDPFIEVKVDCPFGTAIVKDALPVYGGVIEKDFEIANAEEE